MMNPKRTRSAALLFVPLAERVAADSPKPKDYPSVLSI